MKFAVVALLASIMAVIAAPVADEAWGGAAPAATTGPTGQYFGRPGGKSMSLIRVPRRLEHPS